MGEGQGRARHAAWSRWPPEWGTTDLGIDVQKPPLLDFVGAALGLLAELDNIEIVPTDLVSTSAAARGHEAAVLSGIDPTSDPVSVHKVCHHLHLVLDASKEHLLGCFYLLLTEGERTLTNPIQALARISWEASATCLWLCSEKISWEERLRRYSQLRLRSVYTSIKESRGFDTNSASGGSATEQTISVIQAECDSLIEFVHRRGWTCRKGKHSGKQPTAPQWVNELPSYVELVTEAATIFDSIPEQTRSFYSAISRAVHADPITAMLGSTDEDEAIRLHQAMSATGTSLIFYAAAWKFFAHWCSVPFPDEAVSDHFKQMGLYD